MAMDLTRALDEFNIFGSPTSEATHSPEHAYQTDDVTGRKSLVTTPSGKSRSEEEEKKHPHSLMLTFAPVLRLARGPRGLEGVRHDSFHRPSCYRHATLPKTSMAVDLTSEALMLLTNGLLVESVPGNGISVGLARLSIHPFIPSLYMATAQFSSNTNRPLLLFLFSAVKSRCFYSDAYSMLPDPPQSLEDETRASERAPRPRATGNRLRQDSSIGSQRISVHSVAHTSTRGDVAGCV
ncbi:hypothetical protein CTA2_9012 [Colletotrichum tanaceti]|nr:hypothetical protein CTA2_9012 [Colletotrichum tanaceti]